MKLSIDSKELELLLEKKRDYIGKRVGIVGIIEAILLIFSAITASYDNLFVPSVAIKFVVVLIAVLQIIVFIRDYRKPVYTKEDLLKDIEKLNITSRTSSIVAIHNQLQPARYLVYEDQNWGFRLFLNYATVTEDKANLVRKLSEQLALPESSIKVELKTEGTESKFSTEHKEEREYYYRIYQADLTGFTHEEEKEFEIEGRKFYWMTIDEMLADPAINEHNHYVVGLVRDHT